MRRAHNYRRIRAASRRADVFVAYPVIGADGRQHIEHAIQQGARAILYEADGFEWNAGSDVPHWRCRI